MRVFVTGGSGLIGGALVARLRAGGHDVTAPTRAALDLLAPFADAAIPERTDVVVHCAAARDRASTDGAATATWQREIAINVHATARLFDAARRRGVASIVHVSTVSVIAPGKDPNMDLDDDAPLVCAPEHPYALTKRWSEDLCASVRGDFHAVAIVRPGMTYAPVLRPTGSLARLAAQLARGESYALAPPRGHRYAPVHVDDVADVLVRVAESPTNVTLSVAGDGLWEREMVSNIATYIGVEARFTEDTKERAMSIVPSHATLDRLFPTRVRTPWHVGAPPTFAAWRASHAHDGSAPSS